MTDAPVSRHESNRHFYDRISSAYDLLADSNERAARLAGVNALEVRPGERVLEVGFGTGNEVLDLARLVGSGGYVAGIDISPGMLAVAQRKLDAARAAAKVELQVADARQLPFADGSFDAVYSSFTLELFPEDDERLVPAYVASDDPAVEEVAVEIGLGRSKVLSRVGRELAAGRWQEGPHGPGVDMARAAPAYCGTCGFFLPIAGSLRAAFGVCGNEYAPADGSVVAVGFGCGAHSDVQAEPVSPVAVAELVYDDGVDLEPAGR